MLKISRSMIHTAHLHEVMEDDYLAALTDQKTRWTSIMNMLRRIVKLRVHIWNLADPEICGLMSKKVE